MKHSFAAFAYCYYYFYYYRQAEIEVIGAANSAPAKTA